LEQEARLARQVFAEVETPAGFLFFRGGSDVWSQAKYTFIEVARPVQVGNIQGSFQ
jgi:hypothetical protein